ncbi:phage baseplate protein [Acinetobacter brisouii]|uniref:phage baseplate protein n=1 Tax=Acinetobacter brisouii TaxID=396323 RepID=UPI00124FD259|nr:hypothetical protein [Acinetobacter brisouii]
MKRIDSVNARPDQNGIGKAGFNDNADLSGQDATYLTPEWCNHVQEEISNVIEGFGVNLDPKKKDQMLHILLMITDRIKTLEARIIEDIKVGDLFITTLLFENGAAVKVHKGYGEWEKLGAGHALLSNPSVDENAPSWMKILGGMGGELKHALTLSELTKHSHKVYQSGDENTVVGYERAQHLAGSIRSDVGYAMNDDIQDAGEGEAFNIIQPSMIVGVWRRLS